NSTQIHTGTATDEPRPSSAKYAAISGTNSSAAAGSRTLVARNASSDRPVIARSARTERSFQPRDSQNRASSRPSLARSTPTRSIAGDEARPGVPAPGGPAGGSARSRRRAASSAAIRAASPGRGGNSARTSTYTPSPTTAPARLAAFTGRHPL